MQKIWRGDDEMNASVSYVNEIKEAITEIFPSIKKEGICDDELLANQVGLDSLSFLQLVVALEEKINITINDDLLLFEHFETVEKINEIIKRCK